MSEPTQDQPVAASVTQLIGTSAAPSMTLGSAASSATISTISTGLSGLITITSAASLLSAGTLVTLTFPAFPNGAILVITAGNTATITAQLYVSSTTATTAVISCATALALSTTYKVYYLLSGW